MSYLDYRHILDTVRFLCPAVEFAMSRDQTSVSITCSIGQDCRKLQFTVTFQEKCFVSPGSLVLQVWHSICTQRLSATFNTVLSSLSFVCTQCTGLPPTPVHIVYTIHTINIHSNNIIIQYNQIVDTPHLGVPSTHPKQKSITSIESITGWMTHSGPS